MSESNGVVRDAFGNPMFCVSVCQSEKVNTGNYGNADIGPVSITGYIPDGPDEVVLGGIRRLRRLVDQSVAEDRAVLWNELQARAAAGQPAVTRPASLGQPAR